MVHEQLDEVFPGDVGFVLALLGKHRIAHFINHVFNLHFCRVVTHGAHQVGKLVDGDGALKLASLGGVLLHGADHSVNEEVVHVLVGLTFAATFNQVNEGFGSVAAVEFNLFVDGGDIDTPHIDGKIVTTASEDVLAISRRANICNVAGVGHETHGLVWVSIEWQLDQADNFLPRAVDEVVVGFGDAVGVGDLEEAQALDLSSIGGSEAGATRVLGLRIPQLHLVVVVHGEEQVFLDVALRIPDAGSGVRLVFNHEMVLHGEFCEKARISYVIFEAAAIQTNREESSLELVVLIEVFTETQPGDVVLM